MSTQITHHGNRYQILMEIDEADGGNNARSSSFAISSLRNSCETLGTMALNASKWIINHPLQSLIAGSTLFAIGIGTGLGIRALINANSVDSQSNNGVKCSELDVLVFGANKGTQFQFKETQSRTTLAKLSSKQTTDNAHVYLNTKALCKDRSKPEDILKDSIMFSCNNENPIKLEPKDLISQNQINDKLNGTQCDPKIVPDLIFKGNLRQGKTSRIKLDGKRMCEQGKIKNFQVKSNNNLNAFTIYASENYEKPFILEFNTKKTVYNIDTSTYCKDIVDTKFRIDCDRNVKNLYIIPKIDLTARKPDLGNCTVTEADLNNAEGTIDCTLSLSLMSQGTCSSWKPIKNS